MKKRMVLLLAWILVLTAWSVPAIGSETVTKGVLTFSIENGRATVIRSADDASGEITIPDAVNGVPVTAIGDNVFRSVYSITTVTIPETVRSIGKNAFMGTGILAVDIPGSVETIGDYAFSECYRLETVTLHEGLKSVGPYAFYFCNQAKPVTLPDSLESIGDYAFMIGYQTTEVRFGPNLRYLGVGAFSNCTNIQSYQVSEDNPYFKSQDAMVLSKDGNVLVRYPASRQECVIPDGVTEIGEMAFYSSRASQFTLPEGIVKIGASAFAGCLSSAGLIIPASVQEIGSGVFTSFRFENNIQIMEQNEFFVIQDGAVFNRERTRLLRCLEQESAGGPNTYSVPSTVLRLDTGAFNRSSFRDVYLPSGLQVIEKEAFLGAQLGSVTLPDSVTELGEGAFYNCQNLQEVVLPAGLTEIKDHTFFGCNLQQIELPENLRFIGNGAFDSCGSLIKITLPASVWEVGKGAFRNTPKLESIRFEGDAPIWGEQDLLGCDHFKFEILPGVFGFTMPEWKGKETTYAGGLKYRVEDASISLTGINPRGFMNVFNCSGEAKWVQAVIVFYGEDGAMVSHLFKNVWIPVAESTAYEVQFSLEYQSAIIRGARIFLWDDVQNLRPVSDYFSVGNA